MRSWHSRWLAAAILATPFTTGHAFSQNLFIGIGLQDDSKVNPVGTQTIVDTWRAANLDGPLTTAVFGWSASPCPAAVKIKFFRVRQPLGPLPPGYVFIDERGPFDVTQPPQTVFPWLPPITQTVALTPPVPLLAENMIAITNLTTCGGPTLVGQSPFPPNRLHACTVRATTQRRARPRM